MVKNIQHIVGMLCIWMGIYCIDMANWKLKKGNESHHYLVLSVLFGIVGIVLVVFWLIN